MRLELCEFGIHEILGFEYILSYMTILGMCLLLLYLGNQANV